jgi:hypothetical protein
VIEKVAVARDGIVLSTRGAPSISYRKQNTERSEDATSLGSAVQIWYKSDLALLLMNLLIL